MDETQQATTEPVRTETGAIVDQTKPVESKTTTPETAKPAPSKDETTSTTQKPSVLNEAAPGAPKEYEAFKVPDGYELDEAVAKEASGLFKGMDLNQANAQKLVDFYVAKTKETAEEPYKVWEKQQEDWRNEVARDPEIGGKLPQVKVAVSRMIDGLGDPKLSSDFRSAMDYTGAGNNPAFIRTMYRLAQMLTEGGHVSGGAPSELGQRAPGARPATAAKALYPNLP